MYGLLIDDGKPTKTILTKRPKLGLDTSFEKIFITNGISGIFIVSIV